MVIIIVENVAWTWTSRVKYIRGVWTVNIMTHNGLKNTYLLHDAHKPIKNTNILELYNSVEFSFNSEPKIIQHNTISIYCLLFQIDNIYLWTQPHQPIHQCQTTKNNDFCVCFMIKLKCVQNVMHKKLSSKIYLEMFLGVIFSLYFNV